MSTIKTKNVQVGTDGTASNNFTIYVPGTPDGTVRIGNGDAGAVTDAVTINSSGAVTLANNLTVTGTVTQTGGATFNGGITGNVAFDTDTLYVDATNNRVGIGTSSPTEGQLVVRNDSGDAKLNIKVNSFDGTNGVAALDFSTGGQGANDPQARIHALGGNNYSAGIVFSTQQSGTTNPLVERMRIDSGGTVRINNTSNATFAAQLNIYSPSTLNCAIHCRTNTSGGQSQIIFGNSTNDAVGSISTSGSSTAYNTSSDYRLKENVAPMSGSIDRLKQLKPSTWSWTQDGSHGEGFLAHEAQAVVPEAVTGTKDAVDDEGNPVYQGIDQSKLVPLLTSALQEAITKIEALEARVATLEGNEE